MARGGTRHLVLSGGEPTLHPQLADLIRFAKSLGAFDVIEMQSNGVKCADMAYARELVEAGLEQGHVLAAQHRPGALRQDHAPAQGVRQDDPVDPQLPQPRHPDADRARAHQVELPWSCRRRCATCATSSPPTAGI